MLIDIKPEFLAEQVHETAFLPKAEPVTDV
jgi:hypothetical protein